MTAYLKWTAPGCVHAIQGGDPIPVGVWTATVEHPVLCGSGWHACRWEDVPTHVAQELWVCELGGLIVEGADRVVAQRLMLVEQVPVSDRVFRLWAADCAERVLPIFKAAHPGDDRPRKAIEAARLFADGAVTAKKLAAARDAAWAAWDAWDAAGAAAWAARAAAWDAWDAWDAAGAAGAARAAGDAAWAAAWAAGDAAWVWQADRLLGHYLELDPARFAHRVTT